MTTATRDIDVMVKSSSRSTDRHGMISPDSFVETERIDEMMEEEEEEDLIDPRDARIERLEERVMYLEK